MKDDLCDFRIVLTVHPHGSPLKYRCEAEYTEDGRAWRRVGLWAGNNYSRLLQHALGASPTLVQGSRFDEPHGAGQEAAEHAAQEDHDAALLAEQEQHADISGPLASPPKDVPGTVVYVWQVTREGRNRSDRDCWSISDDRKREFDERLSWGHRIKLLLLERDRKAVKYVFWYNPAVLDQMDGPTGSYWLVPAGYLRSVGYKGLLPC